MDEPMGNIRKVNVCIPMGNRRKIFSYLFLTALSLISLLVKADFSEDVPTLLILRDALDPYNSSIGKNWTGSQTCSEWLGVNCYDSDTGRVTTLFLNNMSLSGFIPAEISNLSYLGGLDLRGNYLHGPIPNSIGNLPLTNLYLSSNFLNGSIPDSIGQLSNLYSLYLDDNYLTGPIPDSIVKLSFLNLLYLERNYLSGSIPASIGQMSNLYELKLFSNHLSGHIPNSIGQLSRLTYCDMKENFLTGPIPQNITNLTNLNTLDLSTNKLTGFIPPDIGELQVLITFHIQFNELSGVIPESLYSLKNLRSLRFNGNQLSGDISIHVANLSELTTLSLQENQLSGAIPYEVRNLSKLTIFDITSNYFHGAIPDLNISVNLIPEYSNNCLDDMNSIQRNATECENFCNSTQPGGPCGGGGTCYVPYLGAKTECTCFNGYYLYYDKFNCVTQSPPAPSPPPTSLSSEESRITEYLVVVIVLITVVIVALSAIFIWCFFLRHGFTRLSSFDERLMGQFAKNISFAVLAIATNNFSEDNLLGAGGFGKVYKGISPDGEVWAVKRATNVTPESAAEFQQEVNAIATMFHRSILSLRGYCTENGEGILVYAFMANGSLKDFMHQKDPAASVLNFEQRISIALGAAEGLHYLHEQAKPTVIHRDVKSDNILLDENFNAHVADFGFLKENYEGGTQQLVGTPGYIDPEYIRTGIATAKSDVFSFGVVLLELITGLLPVVDDPKEKNTKISLVTYAHEYLQWDISKMMDLKLDGQYPASAATSLIVLAEKCVSKFGDNRPTMQDVCGKLINIRSSMVNQTETERSNADEASEELKLGFFSMRVDDESGSAQTFAFPFMSDRFMRMEAR